MKKSKAICLLSVITAILLSTVCFGSLMWSYIVSCSNACYETKVGIFQKQGLMCYGTTNIVPTENVDAGLTVFLETIDEEGDWVTVTAWEDIHDEFAIVEEEFAVGKGTYRLYLVHKAYAEDDHSVPLETFYNYSETVVIK